jgi:hypothetical protein
VLNSVDSPLRIEHVEIAGGGQIGMTLCPGKMLTHGHPSGYLSAG